MRRDDAGFAQSVTTLRARFGWSQEEATAAVEQLETLASRIDTAIKPANFTRFLLTPNPALRGYPPLELLHSAHSFEDLLDFVESAQSGDMI